jgi:hypothetical protein
MMAVLILTRSMAMGEFAGRRTETGAGPFPAHGT